jgi:hypothetical protein
MVHPQVKAVGMYNVPYYPYYPCIHTFFTIDDRAWLIMWLSLQLLSHQPELSRAHTPCVLHRSASCIYQRWELAAAHICSSMHVPVDNRYLHVMLVLKPGPHPRGGKKDWWTLANSSVLILWHTPTRPCKLGSEWLRVHVIIVGDK